MIKAIAIATFTAGAAGGTFVGFALGKGFSRTPKEVVRAKDQAIEFLQKEVDYWRKVNDGIPTEGVLPDTEMGFGDGEE